jgi:hypothetical protein
VELTLRNTHLQGDLEQLVKNIINNGIKSNITIPQEDPGKIYENIQEIESFKVQTP